MEQADNIPAEVPDRHNPLVVADIHRRIHLVARRNLARRRRHRIEVAPAAYTHSVRYPNKRYQVLEVEGLDEREEAYW